MVESFPVNDRVGKVLDHWAFRSSDWLLGLVGLIGALRRRMKYDGAWVVRIRSLDAPRGSAPSFAHEFRLPPMTHSQTLFEPSGTASCRPRPSGHAACHQRNALARLAM